MDSFTDPLAWPAPAAPEYVLHLFITGATPNSTRAVHNIKALCEEYLKGRYELLIVDMYQQPGAALDKRRHANQVFLLGCGNNTGDCSI